MVTGMKIAERQGSQEGYVRGIATLSAKETLTSALRIADERGLKAKPPPYLRSGGMAAMRGYAHRNSGVGKKWTNTDKFW
jgi:hypothetical protein